jgi:hypothetical protein
MLDGAWDVFDGAWGVVVVDGCFVDADRNMSCHAGVVAVFGSEYGTISIFLAKKCTERERERK